MDKNLVFTVTYAHCDIGRKIGDLELHCTYEVRESAYIRLLVSKDCSFLSCSSFLEDLLKSLVFTQSHWFLF